MARTILLYGATGYSGRLIAEELKLRAATEPGTWRIVLAGRDADRLRALAESLDLEYCVFGLGSEEPIVRALFEWEAEVLLNAAGPFAWTAPRLARCAIAHGCHYVDINGEADVYQSVDDQGANAWNRGVALVSSAGFWAAASNLLLDSALDELARLPATAGRELGTVRIAMSAIRTFSRGSAATVWRSLREQVTVVRKGRDEVDGDTLLLWHEPVGKHERSFDFGVPGGKPDRRIASASSLVDTLAARWTLLGRRQMVRSIESYVEAGMVGRAAYRLGAVLAPLAAIPAARSLVQQSLAALAEGPSQSERDRERHIIVLEIEDAFRSVVIDWRWETPNVYAFTAQLAVAVAARLGSAPRLRGWLTPSEVLGGLDLPLNPGGQLRGCQLHRRRG